MLISNRIQPANSPPPAAASAPARADEAKSEDRVQMTLQYDARGVGTELRNLRLKGSFNPETGAFDPTWNQGQTQAMYDDGTHGDKVAGDRVFTATVALAKGQEQTFEWGVVGDTPQGNGNWLMTTERPASFRLDGPPEASYAPVSNHLRGVQRVGEDGISFRTWSPEMGTGQLADYRLCVDLFDSEGNCIRSLPMEKDARSGDWSVQLPTGWSELEGTSYQYSARNAKGELLTTADGRPVRYSDPESRYLQGQQRGLERIFVDPVLGFETGWYDDSSKGGPNYADNPQYARFTVDSHPDADQVRLVLRDADGHQLTRDELLSRLGRPEFTPYDQARPEDRRDVDVLKNWQLDKTTPINAYLWTDQVAPDGSINMRRVDSDKAGTAWVSAVNNFPKLVGLSYEFEVIKDGKLVGDTNGDGRLQPQERIRTSFNDAYSNVISPRPGSARNSLIRESSFRPLHSEAPRKESDPSRFVVYEAHVGSFMGSKDNAVAATFDDMINNLGYLEKLGVNTLELMPTNEFGGKRDWGYTPDYYFAGADAYGFEMDREQAVKRGVIKPDQAQDQSSVWVSGTDAIKLFVDEAHARGFNVMADVVYNHTSGRPDGDNPLGMIDGDRRSFFRWWGDYESHTPWGAKPNFAAEGVKDFLANNAAQQVTEFGFDGIRFDFTQVLHNTGSGAEQVEGMNALRQIHRTLSLAAPDAYTVAEDFSGNWLVAADLNRSEWQNGVEKKGMGFDGVWNDRYRDDVYAASAGKGNVDRLMESLTSHIGVSDWGRAVLYAHSHDEVGNSGEWIGRAAAHSKDDARVMDSFPRAVSRSVAALTLTGPGVPMIWQGEEFIANNDFKHGLTSTWGHDTDWLSFPVTPDRLQAYQGLVGLDEADQQAALRNLPENEREYARRYLEMDASERPEAERMAERWGQFKAYQDLIALRAANPSLSATAPVRRLYTHNEDGVMAFSRGQDDFVVVSNFSGRDREHYAIPLPAGRYQEVFNSNSGVYGGTNSGNGGGVVENGSGLTLPAGSTVVFQRV